jgi:hypothetical protein
MDEPMIAISWKILGGLLAVAFLGWNTVNGVGLIAYEHDAFTKTFDAGVRSLDIRVHTGNVTVIADRTAGVVVDGNGKRGLVRGKHSETVSADGSTLQLRSNCPSLTIGWCALSYTIHIPADIDLHANSDNGTLRIDGMKGNIQIQSSNGAVRINNSAGDVQVSTDNGNVRIIDSKSRIVHVDTDNGGVRTTFISVPQDVQVQTDNGNVVVQVPHTDDRFHVETKTDNGSVKNDLGNDTRSDRLVDAQTDNGNITLTYRDDL